MQRRNFLGAGAAAGFGGALSAQSSSNDFHFALIGDRTGTAHPQIYSRVWHEVSLFDPDFAVSIGDTIQGLNDATAVNEWDEIGGLLKRYQRFPLYYTPGNHDIWSPASASLYSARTGRPTHYSFLHQRSLFIVLDNSLADELSPAQLAFCAAELEKHATASPKFVFFHRPFWLINIRVGNSDFPFHQLVRKHKVDYVVSGHGHQLVHLERDGVRYLEIGSSGGTIARGLQLGQGFKDGWFYHWMWFRVRGNRISATVKEIGPAWGHGRTFRLDDWGPAGAKFDPSDPALIESPRL